MVSSEYHKAIADFENWINAESHIGIDSVRKTLIVVRDGIWVDAFVTFRKERMEG